MAAKTDLIIQFAGGEVSETEVITNIKKAWVEEGHKIGEIKSLCLYVKPEELKVYYVINDKIKGAVNW